MTGHIQQAIAGIRSRDVLGLQRRAAARQDRIRRERAYMNALGARIAELNTMLHGQPGAADARAERGACERELTELEDRYGPRPGPYSTPDIEAG